MNTPSPFPNWDTTGNRGSDKLIKYAYGGAAMNCPKGCTLPGDYPQKMRELGLGHYICPQSDCGHEIKEKDPQFLCVCAKCSKSN